MKETYDAAMTRGVFPWEGGYTNDANDPGGPTNWGITIADARAYWKPTASAADVKSMPKSMAEDIYRKHYAIPIRYDDLPAGVDISVLDYAINSGVGRSGKVLRRLVGLPDNTSAVTDEVIAAVKKRDPKALINAIDNERLAFLKTLKIWPTYANGWSRRVTECRTLALALLQAFPLTPVSTPLSNRPSTGKGKVPEPKVIKNIVVAGGGAGSAGLIAWAHQHPSLTLLSIGGAVAAIAGVIYLINRRHESQQTAATPGITPVPEAA